jgi:prolyl oligopeptidase
MYGSEVSDDGRYLILSIFKDTNPSSKTWILDLTKTDLAGGKDALQWQKIVDEFGCAYSYIANDDTRFYFQTNAQAPKYKMVTLDLAKPQEGFEDLIKEDPDSILTSASVVNGDDLLLLRSRDVKDELSIHDLKTGQRKGRIGRNLIGTFGEMRGRRHHKELFFKVVGFSNPGLAYRYSFEDNQGEKLFRATVVKGLQQDEFETQQVFYESKDGTRVPMFIVTPRGVAQDGSAPALLYGYGGFSISMDPFFR